MTDANGREIVSPLDLCRCGCDCPATWLCDGYDFDPHAIDHRGKPFRNEPCCEGSKAYLEDASAEFGHPFTARRIQQENKEISTPVQDGELNRGPT